MNETTDKKRAILHLQRLLMCLHNAGYPLLPIVPDGIYGEQTQTAVSVFQSLAGLKQTGRVDEETWTALQNSASEAMKDAALSAPIYPFEYMKRGTVSPGDRSDLIYIVQVMLRTLEVQFTCLEAQSVNGQSDGTTTENIKRLQRIWKLAPSGEVDRKTWDMLAAAYNIYMNRE